MDQDWTLIYDKYQKIDDASTYIFILSFVLFILLVHIFSVLNFF